MREPLAAPPDPSLELLSFSTGVNSTPESDGVLFFSSIMSPSEDERLCFDVTGLLAGRGNTLDKFKEDPLSESPVPGDSEPTFCKERQKMSCHPINTQCGMQSVPIGFCWIFESLEDLLMNHIKEKRRLELRWCLSSSKDFISLTWRKYARLNYCCTFKILSWDILTKKPNHPPITITNDVFFIRERKIWTSIESEAAAVQDCDQWIMDSISNLTLGRSDWHVTSP